MVQHSNKRDFELLLGISHSEQPREGILSWSRQICLIWRRNGLFICYGFEGFVRWNSSREWCLDNSLRQ